MDLKNIFRLYQLMSNQHFMMSYNGVISQQLVVSLLSIAEKKLDKVEEDSAVRKKVFNVMIECLQSVCKGEAVQKDTVFMLGKDDENYTLYTCFYCSEAHQKRLVAFLDEMEKWDSNRLRDERRILLTDVTTGSDLSSLFSLIDITLKSKNKINYDYLTADEKIFFSLRTIIRHTIPV